MHTYTLTIEAEPGAHGLLTACGSARARAPHPGTTDPTIAGGARSTRPVKGCTSPLPPTCDGVADVEVDDYETASGLHANMMLSGGWDELLILPEMDVDKAIKAARTAGDYPMPGQE